MSIWQRLFGSRKITQRTPQRGPAAQRPAASTKPKTPLPGSPEVWAEALKAKKDYAALAAVTHEPYSDQLHLKAGLAFGILKQAGAEAVPAILEEIAARAHCHYNLADVLVHIGDQRAVQVLEQALREKQFDHVRDTRERVERFVAKFDAGFVEELKEERKLAKAREEAAADARLTAPPAPGTQLREYARAYVFRPPAEAKRAFDTLQSAIRRGNSLPLDAPHQVALVHGPAADFVAVLVRLATAEDESVALHRRVVAWFAQTGAGTPLDDESLRAPLPGRLSRGLRYLAGEYTVLELIDRL